MSELDIVSVGQASIDTITNDLGVSAELLGGSAVYIAMIGASLGLRTGLVTNIGTDYGSAYLERFQELGIDTRGVNCIDGPSTRLSLFYVGEVLYQVLVSEGVGSLLAVADIPTPFLSAKVVHIAPGPLSTQIQVAELMKKNRVLVSFDPHTDFNDRDFSYLREILRNVDIFHANDQESLASTGETDLIMAIRKIQNAGPRLVIVTRGSKGAIISTNSQAVTIQALKPIGPIRDYVGAGDAFVVGFLFAWRRGISLRDAGYCAAATAACIIQGWGLENLPTIEKITQILRANDIVLSL